MDKYTLRSLEDWYFVHCDGDWEHEFGLQIDTLDNPGWIVKIDLLGTECENNGFNEVDEHLSDLNWLQCSVNDNKFIGVGGPQNLVKIIQIFFEWVNHINSG